MQRTRIPALSVLQPWATLLITGAKRVETRSWACPAQFIGTRIAIHASKRFPQDMRDLAEEEPFLAALAAAGHCSPGQTLPRGAVLGTVIIRDCYHTEDLLRVGLDGKPLTDAELEFGDFSEGRWGWVCEDPQPLETPYPVHGSLGLWRWDAPASLLEVRS